MAHTVPNRLLIGTGGSPLSTPKPGSAAGIARVRELGLDCMELAFVHKVTMGPKTADEVNEAGQRNNVALSVHGPYYINLNSAEPEKLEASRNRILLASRVGYQCGARNIVFHAGFYQDQPPDLVYPRMVDQLADLQALLRSEGVDTVLRPETTGKVDQFGTLDELLTLCAELPGIQPCVDFAHLHARTGAANSYAEFREILERIEKRLGRAALDDMHIHLSGIQYGTGGERKHLMLEESDLKFLELIQALADLQVKGLLILESPETERDALLVQDAYRQMTGAKN